MEDITRQLKTVSNRNSKNRVNTGVSRRVGTEVSLTRAPGKYPTLAHDRTPTPAGRKRAHAHDRTHTHAHKEPPTFREVSLSRGESTAHARAIEPPRARGKYPASCGKFPTRAIERARTQGNNSRGVRNAHVIYRSFRTYFFFLFWFLYSEYMIGFVL